MYRCGAYAAIVLLLTVAPPAKAQVEPIRITYSVYEGCPDETEFLRDFQGRTQRARLAPAAEAARSFDIRVTAESNGVRGILGITNADGSVSGREVTGESCNEVVSALALVAALAVDPSAASALGSRTGPADSSPAISPLPSTNAQPLGTPSVTAQNSAGELTVGATTRPMPSAPQSAAESPFKKPAGRSLAIGVQAQSFMGLVPQSGFGGGVFLDVTGRAKGVLVPSIRTSFVVTAARVAFTDSVGADFNWFVARFEVCPLRFGPWVGFALSLCPASDVGFLRSSGRGLQTNLTDVRPWLALSGFARLGWPQGDSFFVEVEGGPLVPLTLSPYSFFYDQGGVSTGPVHQIPPVGAAVGMNAGYRFP